MVKAKGIPCDNCCCNTCENVIPENLRCCCRCVCNTICVTVKIPGDDDCLCNEVKAQFAFNCVSKSWSGTIECSNLSIDLEFILKTCDDKCYICLKSTCLEILGTCPGDCVEITPNSGNCRGSYDGRIRTGGISVTFPGIDFSKCGDLLCGTGSIEIECAEIIIPSCTSDECDGPLCEGCDCMSRCLCVVYRRESDGDGNNFCFTELATICWDDVYERWKGTLTCEIGSGTIDIEITLEDDGYGNCVFRLKEGGIDRGIATVIGGCPNVSLQWNYLENGQSVEVNAFSLICGDCEGDIFCDACQDVHIPRVLNGVLEGNCTELGCSPAGKEFIFVNSGGINNFCWEGFDQSCSISLQCRDAGNAFDLCLPSDLDCSPCVGLEGTIISCDPFEVLYVGFTGPYCNLRVTE